MTSKNFLGVPSPNLEVSRIFPMTRLEQLFREKTLVLVRPSMWDDPFENFFLKCHLIERDGTLISMDGLRRDWYGLCWASNAESDALWRIYSHPPVGGAKDDFQGVRIKTKLQKLADILWDKNDPFASLSYFIGMVSYHTQAGIEAWLKSASFRSLAFGGQNDIFARTLLVKREAFSHEAEIRMLACVNANTSKRRIDPLNNNLLRLTISPNDLIEEVLVDPRLEPARVASMIARVRVLGFTGRVLQSDLYQFTPQTIPVE